MNIQEFRNVIKKREETNDEYAFGVEQCWKEEITLLTEDIPSSIRFLEDECTAEEYSWISEIIDDVAEQTGNWEIVNCYKALMQKYPEECKKYNIAGSIKSAEEVLRGKSNESGS